MQVADRWHLLKNLREVLVKVLERDHKLLVVRGESSDEAHKEAEERARPDMHAAEDGQRQLDDILGSRTLGPTVKSVAVATSAGQHDWSNTDAPSNSRSEG